MWLNTLALRIMQFILMDMGKCFMSFLIVVLFVQDIFKKYYINRKSSIYLHFMQIYTSNNAINRLKAVLAEQGKTNKWLAERLSKNETTISRWCTNEVQPSMANLVIIAKLLEVDVKELINSTKSTK